MDLSVNFLRAGMPNEDIYIDGYVLKSGKKLGFTQVDLKRKSGRRSYGRHTKAFAGSKSRD